MRCGKFKENLWNHLCVNLNKVENPCKGEIALFDLVDSKSPLVGPNLNIKFQFSVIFRGFFLEYTYAHLEGDCSK